MTLNKTYLMKVELLGGIKRFFMSHDGILFIILLIGIPAVSVLFLFIIAYVIMYPIILLTGLI